MTMLPRPNQKAMEAVHRYKCVSRFRFDRTAVYLGTVNQPELKQWIEGIELNEANASRILAEWRKMFWEDAKTESEVITALGVRRIRLFERFEHRRHFDLAKDYDSFI